MNLVLVSFDVNGFWNRDFTLYFNIAKMRDMGGYPIYIEHEQLAYYDHGLAHPYPLNIQNSYKSWLEWKKKQ